MSRFAFSATLAKQQLYSVDCWNCDEGYVEPIDEWDTDVCSHCKGKGFLVVSELTDDNCENAIPIPTPEQTK